jgi:hypothetical protein
MTYAIDEIDQIRGLLKAFRASRAPLTLPVEYLGEASRPATSSRAALVAPRTSSIWDDGQSGD